MAEALEREFPVHVPPAQDGRTVGLATRAISLVLDALLINFAAIMAGSNVALVLAVLPLDKDQEPAFEVIAVALYIPWCAVYFIAFWSIAGQTPGGRVMQIRLVTANGERIKPARALVRWVGMNLALVPLFAGYLPILFGRRGLPDWLAHTLVARVRQPSLAEARSTDLPAAHMSATAAAPDPVADPRVAMGSRGRGSTGLITPWESRAANETAPPEHGRAQHRSDSSAQDGSDERA